MRKETILPSGVKIVETRYDGGFTEISVYRPTSGGLDLVVRPRRKLVGVISRQIKGGKWVVHTDLRSRAFLSRVKAEAVNWAINYAEEGN